MGFLSVVCFAITVQLSSARTLLCLGTLKPMNYFITVVVNIVTGSMLKGELAARLQPNASIKDIEMTRLS